MSDEGFDFRPPPDRREARRFEPPPWERDAFEQHAREQAEREAATEEARARVLAEEEAARAAAGVAEDPAPAIAAEADLHAADVVSTEGEQAPPPTPAPKAEVDDKQVAMMMLGLRAEEPTVLEGAWVVNLVAGCVVAIVGLAAGIWGTTALARKGLPPAGTLGGVVLLGFGLGFLGIGGWLIFRALQQRGVL